MHSPSKIVVGTFLGLLCALQASALTVASPAALTTCQPVKLSWSDGTAPYYPTIIPGGDPSGTPLVQFNTTSSDSVTWMVNLAAGTQVTIAVTDSTGTENYSSVVTIQAGTSTSCVGASSAAVAATGGAATSSKAAAGTTSRAAAAGTTSAVTAVIGAATTEGVSSSTPSASPSAADADASSGASHVAAGGLALLAGAAVAALL